jgi:hypothetical protein
MSGGGGGDDGTDRSIGGIDRRWADGIDDARAEQNPSRRDREGEVRTGFDRD